MNAITLLSQSFDFGTVLTYDQLKNLLLRSPQVINHIERLANEETDNLSDDELYGPAPRDESFNELSTRDKMQKSHAYGMRTGWNQALYGYCAFRIMPINGLDPEFNVALYILGVKYDAGMNNDGKHQLVLQSPNEPTEYLRIDLGDL